jgi:poly(3-hydroxybutyrate) depolymerase
MNAHLSKLTLCLALLPFVAPGRAFGAEASTNNTPEVDAEVARFLALLKGGKPASITAAPLSAGEVGSTQQKLWARYKAAAIALGWDKEMLTPEAPPIPPKREPGKKPAPVPIKAGVIPCGGEKMPYVYLKRGGRPANGFPLFFQTHGGGSTDEKLAHPHAWAVNTRDWQAQFGLCLQLFPEGVYFIPRMANDNKGRWWMKHNQIAFDAVIRRAVLFHDVDPNRIYMMGISEGAYGTEALTPFWGDRFAGGCAMAGGAGGGERLYNLRNTAFRNDTGEKDTMYGRINLATQAHDYLENLKKADPAGYDHKLNIQAGRGHSVDYVPGPAWIATKTRDPRPTKVAWFNHALDGNRRTDFSWLSLDAAPARDTLIVAEVDRKTNTVTVSALVNPPAQGDESAVYNTDTKAPVANRVPYTGNTLTVHLDDKLLDLDNPVTVMVNGKQAFTGRVERLASHMAEDIARTGDPGRVFPGHVRIAL